MLFDDEINGMLSTAVAFYFMRNWLKMSLALTLKTVRTRA